jgi:hypothetical protein
VSARRGFPTAESLASERQSHQLFDTPILSPLLSRRRLYNPRDLTDMVEKKASRIFGIIRRRLRGSLEFISTTDMVEKKASSIFEL